MADGYIGMFQVQVAPRPGDWMPGIDDIGDGTTYKKITAADQTSIGASAAKAQKFDSNGNLSVPMQLAGTARFETSLSTEIVTGVTIPTTGGIAVYVTDSTSFNPDEGAMSTAYAEISTGTGLQAFTYYGTDNNTNQLLTCSTTGTAIVLSTGDTVTTATALGLLYSSGLKALNGIIKGSSISGSTFTGGTIQTATGTGQRVVIDTTNGGQLKFYDSGNNLVVKVGENINGTTPGIISYGIIQVYTNNIYGIYSTINNATLNVRNAAGTFIAQGDTLGASGINIGVYGEASNATTNWAGFFAGNVHIGNYLRVGGSADFTTAANGIKFGSSEDTNLYRSAANTLTTGALILNAGNLTVSGTGNSSFAGSVSIGTTSPILTLDVSMAAGAGGSIKVGNSGVAAFIGEDNSGAYWGSNVYVNSSGWNNLVDANPAGMMYLDNAGAFQFYTRAGSASPVYGTSKMTILNNGNVLIGTTTDAGYKSNVNGTGLFKTSLTTQYPSGQSITIAPVDALGNTYTMTLTNASLAGNVTLTLPATTGTVALASTTLTGYGIVDASRSYDIYNSAVEAGSGYSDECVVRTWSGMGGTKVKIRATYLHRTGNINVVLRGVVSDGSMDVNFTVNSTTDGNSYDAGAFSIPVDVSSFTNGTLYNCYVEMNDPGASGAIVEYAVISVQNY